MKPSRAFFAIGLLCFLLGAIPVSTNLQFKTSFQSFFEPPLTASRDTGSFFRDLIFFRTNARENRILKSRLAQVNSDRFQMEELKQENARLNSLLSTHKSLPPSIRRVVYSRVLINSPFTWNKIILIDKGSKDGVRANKLVLSDFALVGKVVEVGPSMSKVRLLTDPNSKIGVMIQRSREQGILFGTPSGDCRMKYLPLEADVRAGDIVETAGFNSFFPKGLRVGVVKKVWREPGQIYQVALVRPLANLRRLEEIAVVD